MRLALVNPAYTSLPISEQVNSPALSDYARRNPPNRFWKTPWVFPDEVATHGSHTFHEPLSLREDHTKNFVCGAQAMKHIMLLEILGYRHPKLLLWPHSVAVLYLVDRFLAALEVLVGLLLCLR